MWTGAALAAIRLTTSASTERQWQGKRRPRSPKGPVRVLTSSPRSGMMPIGIVHDEAAGHRARRLLSRSNSGFHRLGDRFGGLRRWVAGERWVKRLAIVIAVLLVIFAGCFGGLWWRLGAGPINLDMATPWLASAIEENIGHGNTVEVGGTQIERAGRIRIAVRIRDIVVRDRDRAIVASAPKAEVKLSGTALPDGTASRREPQSGRCRTRRSHHAGWHRHGFRRRHRQAARHRCGFEEGCRAGADISASAPGERRSRSEPLRRSSPGTRVRARLPTPRRADCSPASTGSTA